MNIFDIIGPVMIGPSSSHTAGVVYIGNMARKILGGTPSRASIKFHGSFAATYQGHGSDKAVIAGLMGYDASDVRIRDSLSIASETGMSFTFDTIELKNAHPNSLVIEAEGGKDKQISMVGVSVGGGNILITSINDIDVNLDGKYDTLMIQHIDKPGVVASVAELLSEKNINIARMNVYRSRRGGDAIMTIETDGNTDPSIVDYLNRIRNIVQAVFFARIG